MFEPEEKTPLASLIDTPITFVSQSEARDQLYALCARNRDIAAFHDLGKSDEGRPLFGIIIGKGKTCVSLVAGAHSDEPVGPAALRTLIEKMIIHRGALEQLLRQYRFIIVPHLNPDGEARNEDWIRDWPDVKAYISHSFREPPGRDVEFGYPAMRIENRKAGHFISDRAPIALHASLHGMGFSDGALLLIERHWAFRSQALRNAWAERVTDAGFPLHDFNRYGEKGFFYIEPGFMTTPESEMMRLYFKDRGEEEIAARFHLSSMEFVRRQGGDPLCLVTELPLFLIDHKPGVPGHPEAYLAFRDRLPVLKNLIQRGQNIDDDLAGFGIRPVDPTMAVRLQLTAIDLGMGLVA